VALASISCVFKAFVEVAMTFLEGAVMFLGGAITFISKKSLAIERSFKAVKAGIADDIKGVIGRNLR
jgi:hypothetical protein